MQEHGEHVVEHNLGYKHIKFKIPHFAGTKSENIRSFLSKFEKVIAHYEIEEDKILNLLGLHLERNALLYFDKLIEQEGVPNYGIIKQNLLQRFDEQEIKFVARARLHKRKQNKGEKVTHFYNDVLTKGHEISLIDDELLFIFLNGLSNETRIHVLCQDPQNIKEALQKAKMYEDLKTWGSQTPETEPTNWSVIKEMQGDLKQMQKSLDNLHKNSLRQRHNLTEYEEKWNSTHPGNDYKMPVHQKSRPRKRRYRFNIEHEFPAQKQGFYEEKINTECNALIAIPKIHTKKDLSPKTNNLEHKKTMVKHERVQRKTLREQKIKHRKKVLGEIENFQVTKVVSTQKGISGQEHNKHSYKRRGCQQKYKNVRCNALTAVLKKHHNDDQTTSKKDKTTAPKVRFYVGKTEVDSGQPGNRNDYKQINTCETFQNKRQVNGFQKLKAPFTQNTPNKNKPTYKINKTVTKGKGMQSKRQENGTSIVTRWAKFSNNSSWKNQATFYRHQPMDSSNESYENKVEHREKTLKEIKLYFQINEASSKQNVHLTPKILRTKKQENKFTDLNTTKLISDFRNKENEEQLLRIMIKRSAEEIHKLELQLASQNDYLHTLMIKYDGINKKCELVIKNAANLADNIGAIQEDTLTEKLHSKNIKLIAENYYLAKQVENNTKMGTNLKIGMKKSAKVFFPPICQRKDHIKTLRGE